MKGYILFWILWAQFFGLNSNLLHAQSLADPDLMAEIARIKTIDHHAHPMRVLSPDETDDPEWDALPNDVYEPVSLLPIRLRPDNPEYLAAWRALYGYHYDDRSEGHLQELREKKRQVMALQGERFPVWVLDQLGIETQFANRVVMGRGLRPPRFRWVSYVDAFLFPLNNEGILRRHSKYRAMYVAEERLLKRYLTDLHLDALPATLDEYLGTVVTPTLERQKRDGAAAVKFEAAYLRTLEFNKGAKTEASQIYSKYLKNGIPSEREYKPLQDFIFHHIAGEAGRLGLAVHFHVGAGGGGQFDLNGSNPLLLESVFDDPALGKTHFVIVHGGWPWTKATAFLLGKTNVYADFSSQTFLLTPHALSQVLRDWLEWYPEKIMFGTDAFSETPEIGWPETAWLATMTARQALGLALTAMMKDGEIARDRAVELARMVLHDNAARLYGLGW